MPIITLTTDFGTRDGYVGAMKGVIARRAPEVTVVELAHDVPPGDIAHGAWVLGTSAPEFPYGTVHVIVVDPGVGSARRAVIASQSGQWYVGPDNGVFAYVTERATTARASCRGAHAPSVPAASCTSIATGTSSATCRAARRAPRSRSRATRSRCE